MSSEEARLKYLASLQILDGKPNPALGRVVDIARRAFDVPIAAVSLIDAEHQWFKAQRGLPFHRTCRHGAICDHTIRSDDVLIVSDARDDERFTNNPLVVAPPHVRFYAGAPLRVRSEMRLGTICIMSDEPRFLTDKEVRLLQLLAEEACEQIHRRNLQGRLAKELARGRERNRTLHELSHELAHKDKVSQRVFRMARIGGWRVDPANNAVTWSDEVYGVLGVDRDFPLDLRSAAGLILDEYREEALDALNATAKTGKSLEIEVPIATQSGAVRWIQVLGERDEASRSLIGTVQDVTARRDIEAELKRVASTDGLTGLANRYAFMRTVGAALSSADADSEAGLLLFDLDGFKEVNDLLGHDAGDRLLTVVAGRLKSCLKSGDIIGRLGGDEFGVLLCGDRSALDVAVIARLMLEAASAPVSYLGQSMNVGASIGIARFPLDASDATTLMKRADIALYSAKRAGGDGFHFYDKKLGEETGRRGALLREVQAALRAKQFTVAYQPIVNLREGTLAGLEALVRWNHPERGSLSASAFLAALEEHNLGRLLSDAVHDMAVAQRALWERQGLVAGRLGLNASAGQLRDVEFTERLFGLLTAHGLTPSHVVLEITEGVLLGRGAENVARRIKTLHDAGVRIALDDFGTGYASLTHLRQFPVDVLKIDASFVRSLATGDASRTIVKTVIDMAHGLGMRAVAEGVEGPEVDAILRLMGCDFGQGFYYGRPVDAGETRDLLRPSELASPRFAAG